MKSPETSKYYGTICEEPLDNNEHMSVVYYASHCTKSFSYISPNSHICPAREIKELPCADQVLGSERFRKELLSVRSVESLLGDRFLTY
jgi:hypothetical protein